MGEKTLSLKSTLFIPPSLEMQQIQTLPNTNHGFPLKLIKKMRNKEFDKTHFTKQNYGHEETMRAIKRLHVSAINSTQPSRLVQILQKSPQRNNNP